MSGVPFPARASFCPAGTAIPQAAPLILAPGDMQGERVLVAMSRSCGMNHRFIVLGESRIHSVHRRRLLSAAACDRPRHRLLAGFAAGNLLGLSAGQGGDCDGPRVM